MVHLLNTNFFLGIRQAVSRGGCGPLSKKGGTPCAFEHPAGAPSQLCSRVEGGGMLPSDPRLRSVASEKRVTKDFGMFSSQTYSWPAAALTEQPQAQPGSGT